MLAPLERAAPDPWVLKGGFALELRRQARRATRDVDIDFAEIAPRTCARLRGSRMRFAGGARATFLRPKP
ncbi:nucleotidyl transferase AbiEii/AbiGii toxin family protein [Gaiella sp.]|uniref:nucleotidyl transferase AbiEii/AbiGii toxin family protein n=1 Tax=Gaiella sp. TaxID=2663207 RepID=UPI0039C858DE